MAETLEPAGLAELGTLAYLKPEAENFFSFFFFLQPYLQHMEVPGPEVESELQLPAYATAITTDPSHICDLHRSLEPCQILNALSEARDGTRILTETTWGP